jgi:hypothetical protein
MTCIVVSKTSLYPSSSLAQASERAGDLERAIKKIMVAEYSAQRHRGRLTGRKRQESSLSTQYAGGGVGSADPTWAHHGFPYGGSAALRVHNRLRVLGLLFSIRLYSTILNNLDT